MSVSAKPVNSGTRHTGKVDQPLSDTEAMLWGLESNPNLSTTMGSLLILERTPDTEWVLNAYRKAVASVLRLRLRVNVPTLGLGNAHWTLDDAFDLDHHVRFMRLAPRATYEDLSRATVQWINDPFDRSRPLWSALILSGLPGGRAALVTKLHHSIADGLGALQMAGEIYDFGTLGPPPAPVDLTQVFDELRTEVEVAKVKPADTPATSEVDGGTNLLDRARSLASLLADRQQLTTRGNEAVQAARTMAGQFPGLGGHTGSELWSGRSRNRRLEWLEISLDRLKQSARERQVRLNDVFVAAIAEGVLRYHDEFGVTLPEISATVVVSTRREGDDPTDNAFTPASIPLPGHGVDTAERLDYIDAEILVRREALRSHRQLLGSVSGLAAALPAGLSASLTLEQARRVDVATSDVPGPRSRRSWLGRRFCGGFRSDQSRVPLST